MVGEEGDIQERIYTIPLGKCLNAPRTRRVPYAITLIRKFIARHMKTEIDKVWIDLPVNELLWSRSIQKPPRRIRVRAIKFPEDNLVEVSLPEKEESR